MEPCCQYSCGASMEVSPNFSHIPHVAWNIQRACIVRSYQLLIEGIVVRVCNLEASLGLVTVVVWWSPYFVLLWFWENVKANSGSRCDCWHFWRVICIYQNPQLLQAVGEVCCQLQDSFEISISCPANLVSHLSCNCILLCESQWSGHEESRVPQCWLQPLFTPMQEKSAIWLFQVCDMLVLRFEPYWGCLPLLRECTGKTTIATTVWSILPLLR